MWYWVSFSNDNGSKLDFLVDNDPKEFIANADKYGKGEVIGSFDNVDEAETVFKAMANIEPGRFCLPGILIKAPAIIHPDILDRYDEILRKYSAAITQGTYSFTSHSHLRWRIQQLREMTDIGKANRWLGFIQGVMAEEGLIKVPEEREFTRPYFTEK